MATKKDLVEAHAFSRRRLVTAFVSGAPGGREVEPVKPGRVLIGGVALSVLLLAGAAIAGFLLGRPPAGWLDEGSFVISKDTGEQYVVLRGGEDPMLQRVPNYVSAELLLGQANPTAHTVRDKYIRDVRLGPDLGIDRAPASLPDPDRLIADDWTACTADATGVQLTLGEDLQATEVADAAFLVRSDDKLWLIATQTREDGAPVQSYRFPMPRDGVQADILADRLGFPATAQAPVVDASWLNLFQLGPDLDAAAFGLKDKGQPVPYAEAGSALQGRLVGDLVRAPGDKWYLLADASPMELTPFAAALYDTVGVAAVDLDERLDVSRQSQDFPVEWPRSIPANKPAGSLCALLHPGTSAAAPTYVSLGHLPTGEADPTGVDAGRSSVYVQPSGGAYVLAGSSALGAEGGTAYVVDSKAQKYALIGPLVPQYIGYGEVSPPQVPDTWMEFFDPGVTLSLNDARRVPEDAADEGSEGEGQ